jgi:hypothetical protein
MECWHSSLMKETSASRLSSDAEKRSNLDVESRHVSANVKTDQLLINRLQFSF